jgi:Fur family ferric uptake transcriptional regulator
MALRINPSREKVLHVLGQLQREISAQELYLELRNDQKGIGLATVYRVLKSLKLEGRIQERLSSIGESLYSLITPSHSHHLNCLGCGKVIPLDICPLNKTIAQISQAQHFKVFYHTIELFGLCAACQLESSA